MEIFEKWEYKFVHPSEIQVDIEEIKKNYQEKTERSVRISEKYLNQMGSEGWEWIHPQLGPDNKLIGPAQAGYAVFRRRVAP